jgi:hypothetical protein
MTWIRRTVLISKSIMELHGISTIHDALRILSIFARTILNFARLTIFMHLVKKTFNDQRFLLSERTFSTRHGVLPLLFLSQYFNDVRLFLPQASHSTLRLTVLERFAKLILKTCNGPLYNQELWMIYTLVQLCLDLAAMLRRDKRPSA